MDLVIENGTLVLPEGLQRGNIGIENGKIAKISLQSIKNAEKSYDAKHKLVFPGIIDSHVHAELLETGEPVTVDDWEMLTTGSVAGGVTAVIDFANQYKDVTPLQTIKNRRQVAEKKSLLNFGLHLTATYSDQKYLDEYEEVVKRGVPGFKLFMINIGEGLLEDADLFKMLEAIGNAGGYALIHAENHSVQDLLVKRTLERGENKPINYATTKPPWTEAEAVERISRLAHHANCPVFIVHLSTKVALEVLKNRQEKEWNIVAESCLHYLTLTEEKYKQENAALYIMGPPLRSKKDQSALWGGIKNNYLSIISSDHCAFTKDQKLSSPYFNKIPYGFMGSENLFSIVFSEAMKRGFSPSQVATLLSTNPARYHGLAPEKGSLNVGTDADISILDPKKEVTVTLDKMHTNAGYTGYEGYHVKGWPVATIVNGKIIMEDGEIYAKPGDGNFLKRKSRKDALKPIKI